MNILCQMRDKKKSMTLLIRKLKTRKSGIKLTTKKTTTMIFKKTKKVRLVKTRMPIIILMLIMSFAAYSQPILQLGAGFTSQNKMAAELSVGYNTKPVFIQVGYIASVTRDVDAGTYLNARIGHRFEHGEYVFEPSAGYAYILKSTDRKYLNQNGMIYSFYAGKVINSGTLLLGVNYSERVILGLLTVRYNF